MNPTQHDIHILCYKDAYLLTSEIYVSSLNDIAEDDENGYAQYITHIFRMVDATSDILGEMEFILSL